MSVMLADPCHDEGSIADLILNVEGNSAVAAVNSISQLLSHAS